MIGLNEIAYKAGDEDVVFRIGADEFVMLTNSTSSDTTSRNAFEFLARL